MGPIQFTFCLGPANTLPAYTALVNVPVWQVLCCTHSPGVESVKRNHTSMVAFALMAQIAPPDNCTYRVQILRQESATARRCPICREQLADTSVASFPLNLAVLDLLGAPEESDEEHPSCPACKEDVAKPLRISTDSAAHTSTEPSGPPTPQQVLRASPPEAARSAHHGGVDLFDEEAPACSAKAVAELFPGEPWLRERSAVRLAAVGLLPALLAGDGAVPDTIWNRVLAQYRLPYAFVKEAVRGADTRPPAKRCPRSACECSDGACAGTRLAWWLTAGSCVSVFTEACVRHSRSWLSMSMKQGVKL